VIEDAIVVDDKSTLGTSTPPVVEETSDIALGSGVAPVELIPMFCAEI